jgi:uncharacterized RDD family membrane protein YckC
VSYEDRMPIETPEGVTLELVLAGAGSRAAAAIADLFVQVLGGALVGGLIAFGFALLDWPLELVIAIDSIVAFLILFGYHVFFELRSGSTPGKRLNGLRVLRDDGAPLGFATSSIRNIIRLVDVYLLAGAPAFVSVVVTQRNQRPGDLAARTIVVRERLGDRPPKKTAFAALVRPALPVDVEPERWDVAGLTREEVVAARSFLERRLALTWDARRRTGDMLARPLRAKVPVDSSALDDETFLEAIVEAREQRV